MKTSRTIVEKEQVIVSTAGHVDHGKTALVKALTGIDADTLPEEKQRGMTIELGFVFMDTPGFDKQIMFIDVPGHEKLIKTMVTGASNVDMVLLVIAADEGISIQTREHFDILQLLRIEKGIIALTKKDLVDTERIRSVKDEVKDFVNGTFLSGASIIPVSSITGEGIEEIKSALFSISQKIEKRHDSGIFRMPIDRVFTMHGFGTVIAGTIISGEVSVGDVIEIFPEGVKAKVRGVQVHHKNTEKSHIGRRTAINLRDVKKENLRHGQCAGAPGSLISTNRLDAQLYLLKSYGKELKNRTRLRLHIGTDEVINRLILLDRDSLIPGESALVQFVLEVPVTALPNDRFIIRTLSPSMTIGGGVIVDAVPLKHKRFDTQTLKGLKKLEGDLGEVIEQTLKKSCFVPKSSQELAISIGEKEEEINQVIENLLGSGKIVKIIPEPLPGKPQSLLKEKYLHSEFYNDLSIKLIDSIKNYFEQYPYRLLIQISDLYSQFMKFTNRETFQTIINDLYRKNILYRKDTNVGLVGYKIQLKTNEQEIANRILKIFKDAGFAATPLEEEVLKETKTNPHTFKNIMDGLLQQEDLVRLSEKVTYHREYLKKAEQIVVDYIEKNHAITVGQLRDLLGISRKYALALLEYFDKVGLTRREEDRHLLK